MQTLVFASQVDQALQDATPSIFRHSYAISYYMKQVSHSLLVVAMCVVHMVCVGIGVL